MRPGGNPPEFLGSALARSCVTRPTAAEANLARGLVGLANGRSRVAKLSAEAAAVGTLCHFGWRARWIRRAVQGFEHVFSPLTAGMALALRAADWCVSMGHSGRTGASGAEPLRQSIHSNCTPAQIAS